MNNISNYTKYDLIRCFLAIPLFSSRSKLIKALDIGEGTLKSILSILKRNRLISSSNAGHSLTHKGKSIKSHINLLIEIKHNIKIPYYKDLKNTAVLLKTTKKTDFNIKNRDLAIKNGAEGCLVFNYKNKLVLPLFTLKTDFKTLENSFDFKKNNILILTFSNSNRWSDISALAVAEGIDKRIKKLFGKICTLI